VPVLRSMTRPGVMLAAALLIARPAPGVEPHPAAPPPAPAGSAVAALRTEAKALRPLVSTRWVRRCLEATEVLPSIPPRTLYGDEAKTRYRSASEADALPEAERAALVARVLDEDFYYNTRYGTPLAYARPLDILGAAGFQPARAKILDFGFGGIGQLRLLASLGAEVHGIEVDPLTRALYSWPGDQGPIRGYHGSGGSVELHYGRFPVDETLTKAVGGGYSLFLSKNTLKRGYIHPEQPVPDRQRIDLGVDDAAFVRRLSGMGVPGGLVMIYNLTPAPNQPGKPYIPWADGRCPFDREIWEQAGFEVEAYNKDDSAAARAMARALGWNKGDSPMDVEADLFAQYSLFRLKRPAKS